MRPKKPKKISFEAKHNHFSPLTQQHIITEEILLDKEELEAIRLKDFENLNQEECSRLMDISQPTFHRLLKQARKKVALMLIKGQSLKIKI
jgi:predicted DNA-binding protein (UPF0251 family)